MSDTNCGNYRGKRKEKPAPKPKTAQERFGILWSMFPKAYKTLAEKQDETREHLAKIGKAGSVRLRPPSYARDQRSRRIDVEQYQQLIAKTGM